MKNHPLTFICYLMNEILFVRLVLTLHPSLLNAILPLFNAQVLVPIRRPVWHSGKASDCQCKKHKRHGFYPWVVKVPQSRKWQFTLLFLSGKFRGQRSLVGYSPWGCKEWNMTDHTHTCLLQFSVILNQGMLFKPRHQSSYKSNFCSPSFHLFPPILFEKRVLCFLLPVSLTHIQVKNIEQQLSLIPDDFLTGCQAPGVCVSH